MRSGFASILLVLFGLSATGWAQTGPAADSVLDTADLDSTTSQIGRVEVLFVASSLDAVESIFGHSALLLIPKGRPWHEGTVFEIVARVDQPSALGTVIDGVTGHFPLIVNADAARSFFYDRLFVQGRSISRSPLFLTDQQKQRLFQRLKHYHSNPAELGSYYFHVKNCALMALRVLHEAGVPLNYSQVRARSALSGISPGQVRHILKTVLLTALPVEVSPSYALQHGELEKKYQTPLRSSYDEISETYDRWPDETLAAFKKMNLKELLLVANALSPYDRKRARVIEAEIRARPRSRVDLISVKELPESFYKVCEDGVCVRNLAREITTFYGAAQSRRMAQSMITESRRAEQLRLPGFSPKSPNARHWNALAQELLRHTATK